MNWPSTYKGAYMFNIGTRHWNHYQRNNSVFLASKMCCIQNCESGILFRNGESLEITFTNPLGVIKASSCISRDWEWETWLIIKFVSFLWKRSFVNSKNVTFYVNNFAPTGCLGLNCVLCEKLSFDPRILDHNWFGVKPGSHTSRHLEEVASIFKAGSPLIRFYLTNLLYFFVALNMHISEHLVFALGFKK